MKATLLIAIAVALTQLSAACNVLSRAGQDAKTKQGANTKPDAKAPVEQVVIDEGPEDWEPYRRLLFVDQTLEEMAGEYASERPADDPFVSALKHKREGRAEEAKKILRGVLSDPESEIRQKIWAWRALGELGEKPPPGEGDKVRGVVLEVPVDWEPGEVWVDTLAAYSDGRVRYLNGKGKLIVWEAPGDERISPLAVRLVESARTLVGKNRRVDKHLPQSKSVIRISVLTFGGMHVAELTEAATEGNTDEARVYQAGTRLFLTLLEEQRKQDEKR